MTVKVLSQAEFNEKVRTSTDNQWAIYNGGKIDPRASFEFSGIKRGLTTRSRTASKLYRALRDSSKKINIVVWKHYDQNRALLRKDGGGGILTNTCNASDEPVVGEGTVFWCRYLDYQFRERAGRPWVNVPSEVVLFHELGHAWQWALTPEFWAASAEKAHRPLLADIRRHKFGEEGAAPKHDPLNYFPAIEFDNMNRHEWPICDELGVTKRQSYVQDIRCTNGGTVMALHGRLSPTLSFTRRSAMRGSPAPAKVPCPHCSKLLPNQRMLESHLTRCRPT